MSSTLQELAAERQVVKEAITSLRLVPVMFELGARPHPPRDLYRAYLEQSHIFVGIYWESYGWVAPTETISGLEDEYRLARGHPQLIYLKTPAPEREPELEALLETVRHDDRVSYKRFTTLEELRDLVTDDLSLLLAERFQGAPDAADVDPWRPQRLPRPVSSLVDREEERAELRELLRGGTSSLVTLTGPAGTGKSRVGLAVGTDLVEHFRDGVFLVELATLRDPELVLPAIAQVLGVRESSGPRSLEARVSDVLSSREVLLLLDNVEQVVDAAPTVVNLLLQCPGLAVLATSRTPLRVRGEQVFPIAPLQLPDRHAPVTTVAEAPAVALFVERAAAARPDFRLSAENAAVVAEICRQVDGLPLAIELTAARVGLLSPRALLGRLTREPGARLELLTGGARDLPARQQTLRRALSWSHELLDHDSRVLFRRLAVCVGGWTLEAAEQITNLGTGVSVDVLEGLQALADASLLVRRDVPDADVRFSMLSTIQDFALEQLAATEEASVLRGRHADYFLELAETAALRLRGPERQHGVGSLRPDEDNLRAAMTWFVETGDRQRGLRLAAALAPYWQALGRFSEGRRWLESLLASRAGLAYTPELGRALSGAGSLAWAQGDLIAGRSWLEESVSRGRAAGDDDLVAHALIDLGMVRINQNHPEDARQHLEESLRLFRAADDRWGQAGALNRLGDALTTTGDHVLARQHLEESLVLSQRVQDPLIIGGAQAGLGNLSLLTGDAAAARRHYGEALPLFRQASERLGVIWVLSGLGAADLRLGDLDAARSHFHECLTVGRALDMDYATVALPYLVGVSGVAFHSCRSSPSGCSDDTLADVARLLGAATGVRDRLNRYVWEPLRTSFAELSEAVRHAMTGAAWDRSFGDGLELPLTDALVLAEQLERPA